MFATETYQKRLKKQSMANKTIYFDHNATTPVLPQVVNAMNEYISEPLNPSSSHSYGRRGKMLLENARAQVAKAIGADGRYQTVFTGSGTEANNIALRGLPGYPVVTSTIEHPSVLSVVGEGLISVDHNGVVSLEDLEEILAHVKKPILISIIYANNEIGVIQPLDSIIKLARKYNALVHSDMTQAFGKIPVRLMDLDIDLVTVSAHKIGGPQGVGALIYKKNLPLQPLMQGGGQEQKIRPGTQNMLAIHGFGIAASLIDTNKYAKIAELRDYLEAEIQNICPQTVVFSGESIRIPNTTSFSMPNTNSETQLIHFDTKGFAVSAGSACSSGRIDLPKTHMSLGYDEATSRAAIRVSLGISNTKDEVDSFIESWRELYEQSKVAA